MSHGRDTFKIVAPRSKFYQGPFGRICADLDPWEPTEVAMRQFLEGIGEEFTGIDSFFLSFANNEMIERPGGQTPSELAQQMSNDENFRQDTEARFSSTIPAGYTYFGQFIDHDITFDPVSSLMRQNDPSGLLNHRTPRLDLDNLYGSGPGASPHLYQHGTLVENEGKAAKFLIGRVFVKDADDDDKMIETAFDDLPRNDDGRALIGDPRNDENAIVSQLQLAFLLAHNRLVQAAVDAGFAHPFNAARQTLRRLYQYVVWHDFVRRITLKPFWDHALELEEEGGWKQWTLGYKDVYSWRNQPFMPVEFSVAAYRFGHSMVRNAYQTNESIRGFQQFAPIFDVGQGSENQVDLRGFRPFDLRNYIQWDWFLEMGNQAPDLFPQKARKIDTKLANALTRLHEMPGNATHQNNVLAFRNLKRSVTFDLPAGTTAAKKFGLTVTPVKPLEDSLWFYILNEANVQNGGNKLGELGSLIVCSTFAGLLKGDPNSFFNQEPEWTPDTDLLLQEVHNKSSDSREKNFTLDGDGEWTLASIIRLSELPVSKLDIDKKISG